LNRATPVPAWKKASEPPICLEIAALAESAAHVCARADLPPEKWSREYVTPGTVFGEEGVEWLSRVGVQTLYIKPGSPWQNGYIESFNGTRQDEPLNLELFLSLEEAKYVAERWRLDYNHHRPHSSLN
jgi:hypothetical protein